MINIGNLTSFQQRALSSLVIVPVFIISIYCGGILFFLLMGALLSVSFNEWMAMAEKSKAVYKLSVLGSVYLAIGLGSFLITRLLPVQDANLYALFLIFMIWACDTGAYFSGKLIGGPKMCPTISPGKTWAGLIGGVLSSGLVAFVLHYNFSLYYNYSVAFFLGMMIACVGQVGDVSISYFKRKIGVKDTGTIIPGHGGVLDRIDSLLLAAPVYLICLYFFVETSAVVLK